MPLIWNYVYYARQLVIWSTNVKIDVVVGTILIFTWTLKKKYEIPDTKKPHLRFVHSYVAWTSRNNKNSGSFRSKKICLADFIFMDLLFPVDKWHYSLRGHSLRGHCCCCYYQEGNFQTIKCKKNVKIYVDDIIEWFSHLDFDISESIRCTKSDKTTGA